MEPSKQSLASTVRRIVTAARHGDAGHPTADELLAYHAGELAPRRVQELQNHLALCHDCTRTVLDLAAFPDVQRAAGTVPVPRDEVAAGWRDLTAALEAEGLKPGDVGASPPSPSAGAGERSEVAAGRRPALLRLALAASLLLALGLGAWVWTVHRRLAESRVPQANVVVSDLLPVEATRRRAGEEYPPAVEVPPEAGRYVLILNLPEPSPASTHRLEVERLEPSSPAVAWTEEGLEPGPHGSFHLLIPRDFLPAGRYRFELFGSVGEERRLLATYEVRIEKR